MACSYYPSFNHVGNHNPTGLIFTLKPHSLYGVIYDFTIHTLFSTFRSFTTFTFINSHFIKALCQQITIERMNFSQLKRFHFKTTAGYLLLLCTSGMHKYIGLYSDSPTISQGNTRNACIYFPGSFQYVLLNFLLHFQHYMYKQFVDVRYISM